MESAFNVIIPLQKGVNHDLIGTASSISVDRDDERMSENALNMMAEDIKKEGVNLFGNHEHNWENILGGIDEAESTGKDLSIGINLNKSNPKCNQLMGTLNTKGVKVGLSVGGNVVSDRTEYDRVKGKKIKVLDKVKIYEVSIVGIPSNADSYLSLPQAIAKSAGFMTRVSRSCPICSSEHFKKECKLCGYPRETEKEAEDVQNAKIGDRVEVSGNQGIIIDMADKIKVKFDNGDFAFFDKSEINQFIVDTRLKSVSKSKINFQEREERAKARYLKERDKNRLEAPAGEQKYIESECKSTDPQAQKADNKCPECDGTGFMGGSGTRDCPRCEGRGFKIDKAQKGKWSYVVYIDGEWTREFDSKEEGQRYINEQKRRYPNHSYEMEEE